MAGNPGPIARRSAGVTQRNVRCHSMELNGTPATPALGEGQFDASLTDNGVGDYTINLNEAYLRNPQVYAISRTASIHVRAVSISTSAIQINCWSDLGETTPAEADLDVLIWGYDAADEI